MIRLAVLLAAALSAGCAEAIFSLDSHRTHEAYSEASLEEFVKLRAAGLVSKAEVLATLGPPIHVIGRDTGEIFVYRRLARDTRTINLNPSMVNYFVGPTPPIPLYFDSQTSGRDDTLMVFFDSQGKVQGEGFNLGIRETGQSGAALIGEGVWGLLK
jgi:hypothetical protein